MSIHLGKWMGCFVVVVIPLLPLCCGGFGGKKALPPPPKPPRQTESVTNSKDILYNCIRTQVCDCGIQKRFETCWDKLPQIIRTRIIDEVNGCELPEKFEYDNFKAYVDKGCLMDRNLTKACYDKVNPIFMEEMLVSSSGKRGEDEMRQVEDTRRCSEPTLTFCSEYPDECIP